MTLHSFANIQVKTKTARAKNTSTPEQFAKYQRLRWLVVDESSTVGLEILATLEKRLQQSTRDRDTWKLRPGGERRPFGGRTLILPGDLWQFPPVKATAIYQNPFQSNTTFQVNALQQICWSHTWLAIPHLFELTREQRCEDAWLSQILHQARHGNMSQEVWSFLHGFPTLHAGSWSFQNNEASCGQKTCNNLHLQPTAPNQLECVICHQERARRCIVGKDPKAEHFLNHPFVHGLNAAKYIAANLRAKWVASTRKHKLLWIIAQDTPLFHVEATELQARRENWLQRHDQSTGGVVGILPLLHNMPIRVTQTLSDLKAFGLFKNTRGILWNWTLHDVDKDAVETAEGRDIVLQRLPLALYVRVAGANWQQHPDLPVGVARIEPVTQTWTLETNGKTTVSRRGFPIASDYAGTAHSFMGATLGACTLDLGTWDATTSREAKIRFEKDKPNKQRNRDIMLFCRGCSPQPHLQEKLLPLREFVSAWDQEEWYRVLSEGMCRLCTQCQTKQSSPAAKRKPKEVGSCAYCQTLPADQTGYCSKCVVGNHALKSHPTMPNRNRIGFVRAVMQRPNVATVPALCRATQRQAHGVPHVHIHRAVEVAASLAPKDQPTMQNTCRNGFVNIAMQRNTVPTVPALYRAMQRQAHGVPHVHIHRAVEVAASPAHMKEDTTPSTSRFGCVKHAVDAMVTRRVQCAVCNASRYHVNVMPHWTCEACTVKSCPKCGEVLGAKAQTDALCLACAYPPCESCGSQRPQESRYRVNVMPQWTCEACSVKSCPKCGQILGPKAQDGAWCLACAYPPCESCGRPRPRTHSEYHAQVMPTWTCEACGGNSHTDGPKEKASQRLVAHASDASQRHMTFFHSPT
ncbi:unnamed protein product [Cladocopium goreaui]|uniref:ATP-dependent DNA helicase n=1 Tax=Cladocopium goreaui TaxID=2562237 RepID=A0A9P1G3R7_9DINO|nr:unnamed protein product [Cladocopium goreaui]